MVTGILQAVEYTIQCLGKRQSTRAYIFKNAKAFVGYIVAYHHDPDKYLHHCYIALSKARCRIRDNETAYDRETFVELLEDNLQYAENTDDGMFMETIRAHLTEREFLCVRLIVLEGWTAEEVSKRLGVSKQAVNQCKRRALDKVKKIYICTD